MNESISSSTVQQTSPNLSSNAGPDLQLERGNPALADGASAWMTVDLFVGIDAVKLHLYDGEATSASNLKDHGIVKFALTKNSLKAKMLSDGAMEAQVVMKSFTMSNTRPANSKFREIIPAAQHDRNQVMILYTISGGETRSALAVATVESPQIIFAIEPVIALLQFFTSASTTPANEDAEQESEVAPVVSPNPSPPLAFRFDLHQAAISILEDDTDPETQAIQLTVKQVLLSQQVSKIDLNSISTRNAFAGNFCFECRSLRYGIDHNGKDCRERSVYGRRRYHHDNG